MDISSAEITLALLAGGAGTRMGVPKAWLRVNDRPILDHLAGQLAWPGPTLLVTAPGRERPLGHERFGREVVDAVADQGPLRGLLTALEAVQTDLLVVGTVDMPNVTAAHFAWLARTLADNDGCGLMLRRPVDGREQIEPFPCAFRRRATPAIAAALDAGRRSVHGLIDGSEFVALDAPPDWPASVWLNLNRPDELRAWESSLKGTDGEPK